MDLFLVVQMFLECQNDNYYYSNNFEKCINCGKGYYHNVTENKCKICEKEYYCPGDGNLYKCLCKGCNNINGKCEDCSSGKYLNNGKITFFKH